MCSRQLHTARDPEEAVGLSFVLSRTNLNPSQANLRLSTEVPRVSMPNMGVAFLDEYVAQAAQLYSINTAVPLALW